MPMGTAERKVWKPMWGRRVKSEERRRARVHLPVLCYETRCEVRARRGEGVTCTVACDHDRI
jgi:hypothetical protein